MNQDSIIVFTDGSSSGNPGPGGWGAIVACPASKGTECDVTELGGREDHTTNNRMELTAVIGAFKFIADKMNKGELIANTTVTIHTDSSYVIQGITVWVKGWVNRGWVTATKEPVSNKDLWEELHGLVQDREAQSKIIWKQIKGHAGIPGNERADIIATAFTADKTPDLFQGPQTGYPINLFVTIANRTDKVVKDDKKSRAGMKAYSYISMINGDIQTHKTWAECESRVRGAKGAKFKKSLDKEDEEKIIQEFRNPKK